MHVIICGAGRVGQGIARKLAREKHEITLIDEDASLVDQASIDLDVRGITGHAAHPDVLKSARAADCEMIIAVTHFDEINMVICQVAHTLFSVPFKVARIRNRSYLETAWKNIFSREGLPVDLVISPEVEVGDAILQRFHTPGTNISVSFAEGHLKLLGFDVDEDSPLRNLPVEQFTDLFSELTARIIGIGSGEELRAARKRDVLKAGDRVYAAVLDAHINRLTSIFSMQDGRNDHVVIIGAGNVGLHVAKELEKESHIRVRLIERDSQRANRAVAEVKRSIVIQGDGLDNNILMEAGVDRADFVIAITDDDKANLLISNLAKRCGARRTLALINSTELGALASDMRVDTVLDPRALTVSKILMRMRRGRIINLHSLEDGAAEVAEGVVLESSALVGKPVNYDDLPEGMCAGAVIRGSDIMLPAENVIVRPDDHIVLFYEADTVRSAEKFFRVNPDFF